MARLFLPARQQTDRIGTIPIGPRRFYQHAAQVTIAGLGDSPRCTRLQLECSLATKPLYSINCRGLGKRDSDPSSETMLAAVVCATPRRACRASITARVTDG